LINLGLIGTNTQTHCINCDKIHIKDSKVWSKHIRTNRNIKSKIKTK
jgi:hypothetical protein